MERLKQQLTMSLKTEITEIELMVEKLKSNDLEFENQVDIYSETLKKLSKLEQKMKALDNVVTSSNDIKHEL